MIWETVLKWGVTAVCGLLFATLCGVVRKIWADEKALRKGVLGLLRADLIRSYEKYGERGYCPIYARDALEQEYEAYHNLGGNGTITDLWNKTKLLPTDPPETKA